MGAKTEQIGKLDHSGPEMVPKWSKFIKTDKNWAKQKAEPSFEFIWWSL